MRKVLFVWVMLLSLGMISACSSDDDSQFDSSIVGTWELKTLYYTKHEIELPLDERDLFVFCSKGQVKVIKKTSRYFNFFPNKDGEYDYSYDKKKQVIQFYGKTRKCIIADGEMLIEGHGSDNDGVEIYQYLFLKKSI